MKTIGPYPQLIFIYTEAYEITSSKHIRWSSNLKTKQISISPSVTSSFKKGLALKLFWYVVEKVHLTILMKIPLNCHMKVSI